jgi:two-component system response regulator NreC
MIKVIICDDHKIFRVGVKYLLSGCEGISLEADAASGEELLAMLENISADIVLLDILMPGIGGIETARRLRRDYPGVKILVISSENTEEALRRLVETGIDGFISKQRSDRSELAEAIRNISCGLEYFGSDLSALLYRVYVSIRKAADTKLEFTPREHEIIDLCAKGLRSKEIADRLFISPRTVHAHKDHIFQKLGINSMKEVVKYALEHGIVGN